MKQIPLYLLSHTRIRMIVLTCTLYYTSARNHQPNSCVPAEVTQITMMWGQYYFNEILAPSRFVPVSCEYARVPQLNLYSDISIAGDLSCLKAVDSSFLRNGRSITAAGGGGGYSIYSWWGGAARPLIPWPRLRQTSLIFLPCLRQNCVFWYPVKTFKVAVTRSCVAFLLCNQWKFNVPGINAKVNGSQYLIINKSL